MSGDVPDLRLAAVIAVIDAWSGTKTMDQLAREMLAAADAVDPMRAMKLDAIPNPEFGQVWACSNPKVQARVIQFVDASLVRYSRLHNALWPGAALRGEWDAWARKSGARPLPPQVKP